MTTSTNYRRRPGRPKGWKKSNANVSKMVLQRAADTRAVQASIEVFKSHIVAGLDTRLVPELGDGEMLPDFGLSLDLVGRSVASAFGQLQKADRRCGTLQVRCAAVRRQTEQLARQEVYPRVVSVRKLIDAQLGKADGFDVHRMQGKTLRKARRLHGQLQFLVWALEDGHSELPRPLLDGMAADRETWLGAIKPGYDRLTERLDELTDLELGVEAARDEKHEALAAFDAAYGEALRWLQATMAFAGCSGTFTAKLRAYHQRRTLAHRARQARAARAEGRLQQTLRSAASSAIGWISGRPSSAA